MEIKQEEPGECISKANANSMMQIENLGSKDNLSSHISKLEGLFRDSRQEQLNRNLLHSNEGATPLFLQDLGNIHSGSMSLGLQQRLSPSFRDLRQIPQPGMGNPFPMTSGGGGLISKSNAVPVKFEETGISNMSPLLNRSMSANTYQVVNPQTGSMINSSPSIPLSNTTMMPIFTSGPLNSPGINYPSNDQLKLLQLQSHLNELSQLEQAQKQQQQIQQQLLQQAQTEQARSLSQMPGYFSSPNMRPQTNYLMRSQPINYPISTTEIKSNPLTHSHVNLYGSLELGRFNSTPVVGSNNSLDDELYELGTKPTLKTFSENYSRSLNSRLDSSQEDIFGIKKEPGQRAVGSFDNIFTGMHSSPDLGSFGLSAGGFKGNNSIPMQIVNFGPTHGFSRIDEQDEISYKDYIKSMPSTAYMKETRIQKVQRYRNKRLKWRDTHTINRNFTGRSAVAGSKPRIKGRFVKQDEYEKYRQQMQVKELSSPSMTNENETKGGDMKIEEELQ